MTYPLLGILGGMGPLASSGFVYFLYQKCQAKFSNEQYFPRLILLSDPRIPDRMQSVNAASAGRMTKILEDKIQELTFLGAKQILICCYTAHYFYQWLSHSSQKNILHLGFLLNKHLEKKREKTLILSSKLTITSQLINSTFAIYPNEAHLEEIHKLIYAIKCNGAQTYKEPFLMLVKQLLTYYKVTNVMLACTELHLIYQQLMTNHQQLNELCLTINIEGSNTDKGYIYDGLNITADFLLNTKTEVDEVI